MTRPRRRRPTFSGPASTSNDYRTPLLDSASDSDQDTSQMLNHRRGSRFGPATVVERWMRRNSTSMPAERPLSNTALGDDDFGVGIPIDELNSDDQPLSDAESLRSKPSTRRASNDSSIDDVCMPLDDDDRPQDGAMSVWPDVSVLDEYAKREAAEQATAEAEALVRESVNEATEAQESGRLRPRRAVPWSHQQQTRSTHNYRFTYFRDDLPATVHSPSIAGLLQPGQSFAELFPTPSDRPHEGSDSTHLAQGAAQGAAQGVMQAMGGSNSAAGAAGGAAGAAASAATGAAPTGAPTLHPQPMPSSSSGGSASGGTEQLSPKETHSHARQHSKHGVDPGPREAFPEIFPDSRVASRLRTQQRLETPPPLLGASTTPSYQEESGPWWLDVYAPTEEEMRVLSRAFGIHPLTSEDIVLHETREKVELFHHYYFVCFTSFDIVAWEKKPRVSPNDDEADPSIRKRRGSMGARSSSSRTSRKRGRRVERLKPLAVYSIVFPSGIITIHYRPTPHTINVRRRIRLLRDYLNVSSDWISYALIDEITDAYQPLIAAVDEEVQSIEEAILHMHGSHSDSDDSDASDDDEKRSMSSSQSGSSSTGYREWRQKGNMLRWIGESRKRVMSLLSLLGNKADVIKGFSKRVSEHWSGAPRSEIAMYLSDIQDHLVTMTQSLNHYEKLLARSHSNYLAQINIDMTRANNEMNDQLSKISVLGTIVLPMNIVTGLWGMNVLVPGQDQDNLVWFWGIVAMMLLFGVSAYFLLVRYV